MLTCVQKNPQHMLYLSCSRVCKRIHNICYTDYAHVNTIYMHAQYVIHLFHTIHTMHTYRNISTHLEAMFRVVAVVRVAFA